MEISDPCANLILLVFFLSPCFCFLMSPLDFISSLPQLAWGKGFDDVVVVHYYYTNKVKNMSNKIASGNVQVFFMS
jgi:hypothetical protein